MEAFNSTSCITMPISYTFSGNSLGGVHVANSSMICTAAAAATPRPTTTGAWMDSRIWSRLPHRLIDRVVAFLPPPDFFRARSVCKRWYGLIFSNSFLELYLQLSPSPSPHSWFLFFQVSNSLSLSRANNNNNVVAYRSNTSTSTTGGGGRGATNNLEGYLFDPYTVSWYRLSFALVPPGFSPASSSGGLVCWSSDEAGSKNLLLCNPLVGSLTALPSTVRPRLFPSIGLAVTNNSSVDIVVAGDDLISPFAVKNLSAEGFHIDGGGFYSIWGTNSSLPRLCSFESGRMVYVYGRFYCMNYSPFSVLAFDVAANHWSKVQAPMRRFLRSPSLVEGRGKLIMVAAVEKSKLNVPKSLRLWGLQACGTTWVEVERMPQQLYVQFEEVEGGRGFNCVGHGEFIVITIRGSDKAVLFDFSRKRWVWIPPCPFTCGTGGGGDGLHGFPYEPRLATPVTGLLHQLALPFQSFN